MNTKIPQETTLEKIQILSAFKKDITRWYYAHHDLSDVARLRCRIKQNIPNVRSIVKETNCLKLVAINPTSVVSRLIVRDYDPFNSVLETPYYNISFIPKIIEMIDEALEVLQSPRYLAKYKTE